MNSLYIMIAKCFEILKKKIINFIYILISLAFGICFFFIKKESRIVKILSIVQSIIIFALNIPIILDISFSSLCSCCCKKKDEENTKKHTQTQIIFQWGKNYFIHYLVKLIYFKH